MSEIFDFPILRFLLQVAECSDTVPTYFQCPITMEIFKDPVVLGATGVGPMTKVAREPSHAIQRLIRAAYAAGHTFERTAIEKWFASRQPPTDPKTNQKVTDTTLSPNWYCHLPLVPLNSAAYVSSRGVWFSCRVLCILVGVLLSFTAGRSEKQSTSGLPRTAARRCRRQHSTAIRRRPRACPETNDPHLFAHLNILPALSPLRKRPSPHRLAARQGQLKFKPAVPHVHHDALLPWDLNFTARLMQPQRPVLVGNCCYDGSGRTRDGVRGAHRRALHVASRVRRAKYQRAMCTIYFLIGGPSYYHNTCRVATL